jgi:hypothetical protein
MTWLESIIPENRAYTARHERDAPKKGVGHRDLGRADLSRGRKDRDAAPGAFAVGDQITPHARLQPL